MAELADTAEDPGKPGRTLLIGLGNPDRGDDGLGPFVIQVLDSRLPAHVTGIAHAGDGAALLERWRPEDRVILIDCVRSTAAPGTIHYLNARKRAIPSDFFHYSSHAFGLAEAVELARSLDRLPQSLEIYGVEGGDYEWGSGLSPGVAQAVAALITRLLEDLGPGASEGGLRKQACHA